MRPRDHIVDRHWTPPREWVATGDGAWQREAEVYGRAITIRIQCAPLGWEVVVYGLAPAIRVASYGRQTGEAAISEARRWVMRWGDSVAAVASGTG